MKDTVMNKESWKIAQSIVGTSKGRPENDFYPTPKESILSLLDVEVFEHEIWECACGNGAISDVLLSKGFSVTSTDLYDHGYGQSGIDFLSTHLGDGIPSKTIITNPPFNIIYEWIEHSIFDLDVDKMALFAKLSLLEGVKRTKLLELTPLKWVYVFRKRQTLTRNGEKKRNSGMIAFAWYVWEKGYKGNPMVSWI